MKLKSLGICAVAALALTSCSNKSADSGLPTTSDSLHVALANQDSLLVILNEITEGMNQIKNMENILASGALNAETPDQRQNIRRDMIQIQEALMQRRQRLEQLEKQLASSNRNNATLQQAIKSLKTQLAQQESTISGLRQQLADANIQIEDLSNSVAKLGEEKDSISNVAEAQSAAREAAERQVVEVSNELNTVYYAIGTSRELKDHNLLDAGFLRKTKVLPSDFDQNYFTTSDKRTLRTIPLGAKKAKVLTNQPTSSYEIIDGANGMKVLKITDPARFWQMSSFLVVKTD